MSGGGPGAGLRVRLTASRGGSFSFSRVQASVAAAVCRANGLHPTMLPLVRVLGLAVSSGPAGSELGSQGAWSAALQNGRYAPPANQAPCGISPACGE